MKVTLAPTLSEREKIALRLWLTQTLESENFCNERTFPIPSRRLVVYINNTSVALLQGTWEKHSSEVCLGRENPYDRENPLRRERLSILLTLTQLCEPSAELTKACSEAIARYLLGEYRSVSEQLVSAAVPVSGLAFCTDNRVASLLGSEWLLPSGEVVDVSGPEWTVCASEVPAVSEPVVDTQFNAGPFGPAFPPVVSESEPPPIVGESQFRLGQRVHWDGRQFGEHDGEITHTPTEPVPYYRVLDGEGREWAASVEELSAL